MSYQKTKLLEPLIDGSNDMDDLGLTDAIPVLNWKVTFNLSSYINDFNNWDPRTHNSLDASHMPLSYQVQL